MCTCNIQGDKTALHIAARAGHFSIVKCLLKQCGAKINTTAVDGRSPISAAVEAGYPGIAKYLREYLVNMSLKQLKALQQNDFLPFSTNVLKIIVAYVPH